MDIKQLRARLNATNQYRENTIAWKNGNNTYTWYVTFHFARPDHEKAVRHFYNVLNETLHGSDFKQCGYKLEIIGFRQIDDDKQGYHVHLLIGLPKGSKPRASIEKALAKTRGIWVDRRKPGAIKPISDDKPYHVTGNSGQLGCLEYSARELVVSDDILIDEQQYPKATPFDKFFTVE